MVNKHIDEAGQSAKVERMPRGIRNHNPGNIRHGDDWQGLRDTQTDKNFCQFVSPEFGIRALARVLMNYEKKHGLNTVRGIIGRWAPPNENNTDAYMNYVACVLEVDVDDVIDVVDSLPELVPAIIHHENGMYPYSSKTVALGIDMAMKA